MRGASQSPWPARRRTDRPSTRRVAMSRSTILTVAALALVASGGLVHGYWTGRWGKSQAIEQAVGRLDHVPVAVGDWTGEEIELDRRDMERTGAASWLARRYQNRLTAGSASVFLVCGRSGPVSVHTPDVCYAGSGYEAVDPPSEWTVDLGSEGAAQLWTTRF